MQDHYGPALLVEVAHDAIDEGTIGNRDGRIGSRWDEQRGDVDLDWPSTTTTRLVETGVDRQS